MEGLLAAEGILHITPLLNTIGERNSITAESRCHYSRTVAWVGPGAVGNMVLSMWKA